LPPVFLPRRTLKIIGKNALFHNVYLQVFHPKNTISWGGVFRLVKPIVEISFTEKMIFGTAHWLAMSLNFTPQIMTLARRRGQDWRAASPSSERNIVGRVPSRGGIQVAQGVPDAVPARFEK
jgi:hypothetical protein